MAKEMAEKLYFSFAFQSICRNSVSYNLPISNRVTRLATLSPLFPSIV